MNSSEVTFSSEELMKKIYEHNAKIKMKKRWWSRRLVCFRPRPLED